jgi:hypothetical protein
MTPCLGATKGHRHNAIEHKVPRYLRSGEARLAEVAKHVTEKTGCKKSTFYGYLSEMETVEKQNVDGVLWCGVLLGKIE